MRRILLRVVVLVAVTAALTLMAFASAVVATRNTGSTTDLYYQPQVSYTAVSPDTVVPMSVPLCHTGSPIVPSRPTIVCYSPDFVRTAYNFPSGTGEDGTGQTILIVDAFGSPTIANDLHVFDTTFGLPDPNLTILCPTGCPPTMTAGPHLPVSWGVETSLDVEWAHAMAPGANIVLVVASTNSGNVLNTAETMAMPSYPGSIMSQSFGFPEILAIANNAQVMQADANYRMAASLGITVLASAGDFGATNGFATQNALFPSSDPFVTSVGGTQGNGFGATAPQNAFPYGLAAYTGPCMMGPRPGVPTNCTVTGFRTSPTMPPWTGVCSSTRPS